MGGAVGLAATMGGATEYQKKNTPHYHMQIHLVNIYQFRTIAEIAAAIEKAWVDPLMVVRFQQWVHCEMAPDVELYRAKKSEVRAAWMQGFADGQHDDLCKIPRCMESKIQEGDWVKQYKCDA